MSSQELSQRPNIRQSSTLRMDKVSNHKQAVWRNRTKHQRPMGVVEERQVSVRVSSQHQCPFRILRTRPEVWEIDQIEMASQVCGVVFSCRHPFLSTSVGEQHEAVGKHAEQRGGESGDGAVGEGVCASQLGLVVCEKGHQLRGSDFGEKGFQTGPQL